MYASRILYVDDDRDSCEFLKILLEMNEDCEMVAAADAAEAVSFMEALTFDLFILDWRLPETSGVDLCRLIRKADEGVPIMFYSAMSRPVDRTAAWKAGANAYLVKPIDLDIISETVSRLLKKSGRSPMGSPKFRPVRVRSGGIL